MWVLQYALNEYNQDGYYSTKVWANKPTLLQLAGRPLETLTEQEIIKIVNLYNGVDIDYTRLVETSPDGDIPLE